MAVRCMKGGAEATSHIRQSRTLRRWLPEHPTKPTMGKSYKPSSTKRSWCHGCRYHGDRGRIQLLKLVRAMWRNNGRWKEETPTGGAMLSMRTTRPHATKLPKERNEQWTKGWIRREGSTRRECKDDYNRRRSAGRNKARQRPHTYSPSIYPKRPHKQYSGP